MPPAAAVVQHGVGRVEAARAHIHVLYRQRSHRIVAGHEVRERPVLPGQVRVQPSDLLAGQAPRTIQRVEVEGMGVGRVGPLTTQAIDQVGPAATDRIGPIILGCVGAIAYAGDATVVAPVGPDRGGRRGAPGPADHGDLRAGGPPGLDHVDRRGGAVADRPRIAEVRVVREQPQDPGVEAGGRTGLELDRQVPGEVAVAGVGVRVVGRDLEPVVGKQDRLLVASVELEPSSIAWASSTSRAASLAADSTRSSSATVGGRPSKESWMRRSMRGALSGGSSGVSAAPGAGATAGGGVPEGWPALQPKQASRSAVPGRGEQAGPHGEGEPTRPQSGPKKVQARIVTRSGRLVVQARHGRSALCRAARGSRS